MTANPTRKTESSAPKAKRKPAAKPASKSAPAPAPAPAAAPAAALGATPFAPVAFATPDFDALLAFSNGNIEALTKSGTVAAKAGQDLNDLWLDGLKAVLDEGASVTKALMACHSLPELMELQGDIARSAYEKLLADSSRFSETSLKAAEDVVEPLAQRVVMVAEHFGIKDAA